jgi:hypothetical protein
MTQQLASACLAGSSSDTTQTARNTKQEIWWQEMSEAATDLQGSVVYVYPPNSTAASYTPGGLLGLDLLHPEGSHVERPGPLRAHMLRSMTAQEQLLLLGKVRALSVSLRTLPSC